MAEKLISIHVTTGARSSQVEEGRDGELRVKVRQNSCYRARELLAEYFSVSKSHVEIVSGQTNRNKRIRLQIARSPEVK
jgi:uncharacterized protein YggU (UPF0235/DUF167 family)